jgi:hypothetical protein
VTFEGFAAAWPSMGDTEREFAIRMNTRPTFVASRSLQKPLAWKGTLPKGDPANEVAKLKEQPGQDMLIYGSRQLVNKPPHPGAEAFAEEHGATGAARAPGARKLVRGNRHAKGRCCMPTPVRSERNSK